MSTKKTNKKTKSKNQVQSQIEEIETIAKKMDEIIRRRMPDGRIEAGTLRGMEPEIRQEALIMSVGGFLQENEDYLGGHRARDESAIRDSMEKCAAITLRICKTRLASLLTHAQAKSGELTDLNSGMCCHLFELKTSEWPADLKAGVIMRAVGKAVNEGKLSVANASVVSMVCVQGLRVEEVAAARKISRYAAYQQIQRVRRVLPDIIEEIDLCF